jgi:hypothetical protein
MLLYTERCFSILEVAETPSYFNFFLRAWQAAAFLCQRLVWVAGWLWRIPQAEIALCLVSFLLLCQLFPYLILNQHLLLSEDPYPPTKRAKRLSL